MKEESQSLPRPFPGTWSRLRQLRLAELVRAVAPPGLRFGGALLQFAATLLIARTLGAGLAGDFFFWSTIIRTCGQVSTFGLDQLALQQVPRLGGDPKALARFLAPVRVTSVMIALGLSVPVVCYALFVQSEISRPGWWYLLPTLCMAGVALCMINGDAMNGLGRAVLGVCYRHTFPTAIFVAALLVAGAGLTPELALLCFTISFVVAGLGALAGRGLRGIRPHFRIPAKTEFKEHVALGYPICLSSLFISLNFIVPLAILERYHPSDQIAYLTTSYRIFILFKVLAMAAYALAMPELSRAAAAGERARLRKVYRGMTVRGILLLGPPMLLTFALAGPVMSMFGPGFSEAGGILRMFLVFGLITIALGPASHLLLMVGKTGRMATYSFVRLVLTGAISFVVIPAFGPIGMAVVIGLGMILESLLCLRRSLMASNEFQAP